jgi:hypothetical protein
MQGAHIREMAKKWWNGGVQIGSGRSLADAIRSLDGMVRLEVFQQRFQRRGTAD